MEEKTAAERNGGAKSISERLPVSVKLAFGTPAFAGAAMAIPIGVLMPHFYSDVIRVPLGYIAIAIALARSFDALTDPVMGWLSDRTKTRWGRRKPYIALGAPFTALAFYLLFVPPGSLTQTQATFWFGISFGLYFLFHTIMDIPKVALGAELTDDYNERSSLFGYRSFFIAAGTISAAIFPTILANLGMTDERAAFSLMAAIYAVLLVVLYGWLVISVPERPEFVRRESNPLVPGVRRALRNRPFRILLMGAIVLAIPGAIPALLMPYYVEYVLQPENPQAMIGIFLVIYLGSGMFFVPLWMVVAKRLGKLRTLIVAAAIGITASAFYFFAGAGDFLFAGCIYFITGTVSMAPIFLIPAMAADVIDYDELHTGKRREGQFSSFWVVIPKFVKIPGSAIPLAILAAVGYVPKVEQSGEVLFWIRFMYSIFPVFFYVTGMTIISRYPLSEAIHVKIRDAIAALAEGESVTDPLTGNSIVPRGEARTSDDDGWFLDHFTPGELRRAIGGGAARIVTSAMVAAGISLLVCLGAGVVALAGMTNPEARPPLSTVLAIVVAGVAFAVFIFHCLRVGPARKMAEAPFPDDIIQAHLEANA
jgi:GPH family glycoside/pentoside/hexuronide:cation symporter